MSKSEFDKDIQKFNDEDFHNEMKQSIHDDLVDTINQSYYAYDNISFIHHFLKNLKHMDMTKLSPDNQGSSFEKDIKYASDGLTPDNLVLPAVITPKTKNTIFLNSTAIVNGKKETWKNHLTDLKTNLNKNAKGIMNILNKKDTHDAHNHKYSDYYYVNGKALNLHKIVYKEGRIPKRYHKYYLNLDSRKEIPTSKADLNKNPKTKTYAEDSTVLGGLIIYKTTPRNDANTKALITKMNNFNQNLKPIDNGFKNFINTYKNYIVKIDKEKFTKKRNHFVRIYKQRNKENTKKNIQQNAKQKAYDKKHPLEAKARNKVLHKNNKRMIDKLYPIEDVHKYNLYTGSFTDRVGLFNFDKHNDTEINDNTKITPKVIRDVYYKEHKVEQFRHTFSDEALRKTNRKLHKRVGDVYKYTNNNLNVDYEDIHDEHLDIRASIKRANHRKHVAEAKRNNQMSM